MLRAIPYFSLWKAEFTPTLRVTQAEGEPRSRRWRTSPTDTPGGP